jgi:glutamine amidotransferase-like uncharacterized protein
LILVIFIDNTEDGIAVWINKPVVQTLLVLILTIGSASGFASGFQIGMNTNVRYSITQAQTGLSGVNVGIYYIGYYDPRVNNSLTALINMYEWMNATVMLFNTTDIINGSLWACEVLSIPEGLGPTLEYKLKDEGLQAIREWISAGGSYIGVRGSAAMAVQYSYFENIWTEFELAVINGTSYEVEDLGHTTITNVTINKSCSGPDLSDMPEKMSVLFKTGRYFLPNEGQELIYIANYSYSNLPAMVASQYGEGNVFISSPHFEYEENSNRDGTDYMDSYDDPDSEWPFMHTITQWLIESSPTVRNITEWPIPTPTTTSTTPPPTTSDFLLELVLIGGGLGLVVVSVLVVFVRRK